MELKSKVKIIYEDTNILAAYKPSFLPTVPLKNDDKLTLLDIIKETYPEVGSFSGYNEWENGILHRLDTKTSGLVLMARNKEAFEYLLKVQKSGLFKKEYLATSRIGNKSIEEFGPYPYEDVIDGKSVDISSFFRHFGKGRKQVLPVLDSYPKYIVKKASSQLYSTQVKLKEIKNENYIFTCNLTSGFKHQVRSHLAWSGHPLVGDELYGADSSSFFGLQAIKLSFFNPENDKKIVISYQEM